MVQKYIERPLLLDGHKFDMRVYVAVRSFAPLRAAVHSRCALFLSVVAASSHESNNGVPEERRSHLSVLHLTALSCHVLSQLRYYGRVAGGKFSLGADSATDFGSHFTVSWYNEDAVRCGGGTAHTYPTGRARKPPVCRVCARLLTGW